MLKHVILSLMAVLFVEKVTPFSTRFNGNRVDSRSGVLNNVLYAADDMEIGALPPLGYFDPLGMITDTEKFKRYRAVERKHGRIAMLAMLGTFVHNNFITFGDYSYLSISQDIQFRNVSNGIKGILQVPLAGQLQILAFCGFVELFWWPASQLDGDYGVRIPYINNWDVQPAKEIRQKNAEINNGRAAMMGIVGIVAQELVTHKTFADQAYDCDINPFGDGRGFF